MRAGKRKFVRSNTGGTSIYLLSNHHPSKQLEPYIVHFPKGSDSTEIMTSNYPCQEFCYVLKGEIEIKKDKKKYSLSKGDSFFFHSSEYHLFKNSGKDDAELIWVVKLN